MSKVRYFLTQSSCSSKLTTTAFKVTISCNPYLIQVPHYFIFSDPKYGPFRNLIKFLLYTINLKIIYLTLLFSLLKDIVMLIKFFI